MGGLVVPVRVDMLAHLRRHEERLDERVHVAGGSLVLQADVRGQPRVRGEPFYPLLDLF